MRCEISGSIVNSENPTHRLKSSNSTYSSVDILKFIFAVCIFFLHSEIFKQILPSDYYVLLLFRLAVPFFFVSSGFFLGKKYIIRKLFHKIIIKSIYLDWEKKY